MKKAINSSSFTTTTTTTNTNISDSLSQKYSSTTSNATPPPKRKTILPPQLVFSFEEDAYITTSTTSTNSPKIVQKEEKTNYMHINMSKRISILNDQIEQFALSSPLYSEFVNPSFPTPPNGDLVWVCGRILKVVDSTGAFKFEIETSRSLGSGSRTPLDLCLMNASSPEAIISIFPGQLVVFQGRNLTGDSFQVVNDYSTLSPINHSSSSSSSSSSSVNETSKTKIITAAGPFHLVKDGDDEDHHQLVWRPFERLLNMIFELKEDCNCLLLQGPFDVDWITLSKEIIGRLKLLLSRKKELKAIYLQPCTRDQLFPGLPSLIPLRGGNNLLKTDDSRIIVVNNPSSIMTSSIGIQFISEDSLEHLLMEEFTNDQKDNLINRSIRYLENSSSLYPLLPAPIPLDLEGLEGLKILSTTKLIISPSSLPPFVRQVKGGRVYCNNSSLKEGNGGHVSIINIDEKGHLKIDMMRFD